MNQENEQEILLAIVETWRPSEIPEYRGFRCANCQHYKNEAWYHWVHTGGYRLPIHMCADTCEPAFREQSIIIAQEKRAAVDRTQFGSAYEYTDNAKDTFRSIIKSWPAYEAPVLKAFMCDACHKDLSIDPTDNVRKGYHVWWKMDDGTTLGELHFHKQCGDDLGLAEK